MDGWTDHRIEMATKLWGEGLSASQIAGEIGGGLSRNAVIGKVNRLGLSRREARPRKSSPRPPRTAKPRATSRAQRIVASVENNFPGLPEQFTAPSINDAEIPMEQRRTLLELNPSTCKWPVGDPQSADFYFCGGESIASKPYCPHHNRVAYVAPQARRVR